MKNRIILLIAIALLIVNVLFLWQNYTLKKTLAAIPSDSTLYLVDFDGHSEDMRGVYSYPGFGAMFRTESEEKNPPLTLVIFFSKAIRCPMSLKEMEVYNRLSPIYEARHQKLVAICPTEDSTAITELLKKEKLEIPFISTDSLLNCSFHQLGISPHFMPFKIFYDSTGTAIYMRGANNTPESQADFERAALRLSDMATGLNTSH